MHLNKYLFTYTFIYVFTYSFIYVYVVEHI